MLVPPPLFSSQGYEGVTYNSCVCVCEHVCGKAEVLHRFPVTYLNLFMPHLYHGLSYVKCLITVNKSVSIYS